MKCTSFFLRALLCLSFIGLNSCSTILSGTSDNIIIQSDPSAAKFVIRDVSRGVEIASGSTPATVKLSRKHEYTVTVTVSGYKEKIIPISQEFNSTALCNLAFGGILGFAVDYVSGAIFELNPQQIQVSLDRAGIDSNGDGRLYGVIHALDDAGQLREIRIPLERETASK